uniref:Clamp Loader Of DNA polymerase n=1 Tax=Florenciella sp. virus SA2 TaxID=3240092 RepID=A0AB39J8U7_9VIRU
MSDPWIEKYRPTNMKDIVLNNENKKIFQNIISKEYYPNLILYGPPGTGKTTTILCLMNHYCKKHNCNNNYIHLNASHERGIDTIRNEIFNFTEKKNLFNNHHKFILLDEADSMTKQAQNNLQNIIKKCKSKVTFILICNYLNRLIDYFKKSFLILYFNQTVKLCDIFVNNCIKNENIKISDNVIQLIKKNNCHDLRSIINNIQNYCKTDILLDEKIFYSLLDETKNKALFKKLNKKMDNINIFNFFFNYLYEIYEIDYKTTYYMKLILFHKNNNFFIEEFIPYIKKLKLKNNNSKI